MMKTCATCKRALYDADADKDGNCCFCSKEPKPAAPKDDKK